MPFAALITPDEKDDDERIQSISALKAERSTLYTYTHVYMVYTLCTQTHTHKHQQYAFRRLFIYYNVSKQAHACTTYWERSVLLLLLLLLTMDMRAPVSACRMVAYLYKIGQIKCRHHTADTRGALNTRRARLTRNCAERTRTPSTNVAAI